MRALTDGDLILSDLPSLNSTMNCATVSERNGVVPPFLRRALNQSGTRSLSQASCAGVVQDFIEGGEKEKR